MQEAQINPGPFEGLWMLELRVIDDDERPGSSFREVWRAEHARQLGLPDLAPSQWSVAESPEGTLRGLHAEPWDKLVHVIRGEAFAAIVDLRHDSPTAGEVWAGTLGPAIALFVGRGLGNSYQVTSENAVYAYLVNGRWERNVAYPAARWDDRDLAIDWPITDERLAMSKKDRVNPTLEEHWASASK
ncbi:MAG: dTDP-4-dehydrorhamnose 3,5-epimerase [Actinomycetota bacterium]